jgi:hypothetical protein
LTALAADFLSFFSSSTLFFPLLGPDATFHSCSKN